MTLEEALLKATELWGQAATVCVETRAVQGGTASLYSVGTTGDAFNWTARGQGASFELAFAEAEAAPYRNKAMR
jgi:hypothetical protein